jgi:hypothetical protein
VSPTQAESCVDLSGRHHQNNDENGHAHCYTRGSLLDYLRTSGDLSLVLVPGINTLLLCDNAIAQLTEGHFDVIFLNLLPMQP